MGDRPVVLVVGAGPGVSGSLARRFAREGYDVALAGLESSRSKAMIALADLDRLMVDAGVEGGELSRIIAVRDTVTAQVNEENLTIESLARNLR